jgi:type I restriction enzyme, S subunit
MKQSPTIRIGDVLHRADRFEIKDELTEYQFAGTYSYAKGIFVSDRKIGSSFGLPKIQRVRTNDFVYCKIMAWEGAFGLVPPEADNCVLSGAFVTYELDSSVIEPKFLEYLFKVPSHWKQIGSQSTGTNVRRQSLHPLQFEESRIPCPTIAEQQTIVARLNQLADKIRQINEHLDAIDKVAEALLISLHHKFAAKRMVRLGDIIELFEDSELIKPDGQYPQVGVRGFGGGLFAKPALAGTETTYRAFNRLYTDAIVLSQVKGWEGALAICPPELAGMFVSPEYRTFRCKPDLASPAYLGELIRTPWFWSLLQAATRGVGARRERTRPEQFLNIELPMPELHEQLKIVEILSRQNELKQRHAKIREANQALIPATLERVFQ